MSHNSHVSSLTELKSSGLTDGPTVLSWLSLFNFGTFVETLREIICLFQGYPDMRRRSFYDVQGPFRGALRKQNFIFASTRGTIVFEHFIFFPESSSPDLS